MTMTEGVIGVAGKNVAEDIADFIFSGLHVLPSSYRRR
jgi:hypothetical protein